jgi:hypothetical protein
MSEDTREVHTVGNADNVPLTREQKKARLAKVLDRGLSHDRLAVPLPDHLHGEWVSNDQVSILEKEALGFQIDKEYAPKRALHSKGDGMSIVGDCVFMTCLKEDKQLIDEIRNEQYMRLNRKSSTQKEETDFNQITRKIGLETLSEGSINEARKSELEAAFAAQNPGIVTPQT